MFLRPLSEPMYRRIKLCQTCSPGPVSISLLYIHGVLLSCLAKFEPVCPCYNIKGSIFITRVSVALNNGWRSRNNIFKHFICLSAFITPALYCAPYYLIVVGFYKVNIIQSIGKVFCVTVSAPVT